MAIQYAYENFEHYLYGRNVTFLTDHEPLVTASKLKKPFGRLGRLFNKLPSGYYDIKYIPGKSNHLPDFLSRIYDADTKVVEANVMSLDSAIDWCVEQARDANLVKVMELISNDSRDDEWECLPNFRRWLSEKRNLYVSKGILKWNSDQIVCPEQMKTIVFNAYHDAPFAGHRSCDVTLEAIKQRFFWIHLPSEVKAYCYSCPECQRFNYSNIHLRAPMEPIYVYRPFQMIGMDFMGPFLETENGNTYIVLAIDHFTKYVIGSATVNIDAETTAKFMFNEIICKFGIMENVLTDRGANFEAHLFKQLCILLRTNKLRTTAYHPPGNGTTERVNKTVKPMLAKYVNSNHKNWDEFIQMAISSYNNCTHASTGISPFEALFGRKPVLVADVLNNTKLPVGTLIRNISDFILNLKIRAFEMNQIMQTKLNEAHVKQKLFYDKSIKNNVEFKINDVVKLTNYVVKVGHSKAFNEKFIGPFRIVDKLNDLIFVVENKQGKRETIHYNRMLRWNERMDSVCDLISDVDSISKSVDQSFENSQINDASSMVLIEGESMKHFLNLVKRRRKKTGEQLLNVETLQNVELETNGNHEQSFIEQDELENDNDELNIRNVIASHHNYNTRANSVRINNRAVDDMVDNVLDEVVEAVEIQLGNEINVRVNANNKEVVQCVNCNNWYEKVYGLRIHQRKCQVSIIDEEFVEEGINENRSIRELETTTADIENNLSNTGSNSPIVTRQPVIDVEEPPKSSCTQQ